MNQVNLVQILSSSVEISTELNERRCQQNLMKAMQFFILTFIFVILLFLPNTFAQDYTRWSLPEGAKARLGKGSVLGWSQ